MPTLIRLLLLLISLASFALISPSVVLAQCAT